MAQTIQQNTRFNIIDILQAEAGKETLLLGNALVQNNPILNDLLMVKGNEKLGDIVGKYTSLGRASRKRFNKGITPSKSSKVQERNTVSMLEDQLRIDTDEARIMNNRSMQIMQEIEAKKENLTQDMTNDIIYGNGQADYMLGLTPRMNSLSIRTVVPAQTGSATALTSFWCLTHSISSLYGFYPEAFPGGLDYVNLGENVPVLDENNNTLFAEVHRIKWIMGLSLKNELMNARLCNILTGSLNKTGSRTGGSGADLPDLMLHTQNQMLNVNDPSRIWYVPRIGLDFLSRQLQKADNMFITKSEKEDGQVLYRFAGLQVKLLEQLGNATVDANGNYVASSESQVS